MPKLLLIDGSSYMHRAFHALPPMTGPEGQPTNAMYGVVNMLTSTMKYPYDRLCFAMDAHGPTFRHTMVDNYKANRTKTPDDLIPQTEPLIQMVEAMGIPVLRVSGVEADDVIGTLATQAPDEVLISTGDKDFCQLVSKKVTLTNTMTKIDMGVAGVIEKYGVKPSQFADYLALMGDSIDNIAGIRGIGPKTATTLLNEWGSIKGIIKNEKKIKGALGEKLRGQGDALRLALSLSTIKTDVKLPVSVNDLKRNQRDGDMLRWLYNEYGFNKLLRTL